MSGATKGFHEWERRYKAVAATTKKWKVKRSRRRAVDEVRTAIPKVVQRVVRAAAAMQTPTEKLLQHAESRPTPRGALLRIRKTVQAFHEARNGEREFADLLVSLDWVARWVRAERTPQKEIPPHNWKPAEPPPPDPEKWHTTDWFKKSHGITWEQLRYASRSSKT